MYNLGEVPGFSPEMLESAAQVNTLGLAVVLLQASIIIACAVYCVVKSKL